MDAPQPKTVMAVIAGVLIAIGPAFLGYMQNRDEISAKYRLTQDEASSGYAALATSVKELQAAVAVQHDYIVKLESHLEGMDTFMLETLNKAMSPRPAGAHQVVVAPTAIAPPTKPALHQLPKDFTAAVQQTEPAPSL